MPDKNPEVKAGLYHEEYLNVFGLPMVSETIQFECKGNINPVYSVNVKWFINGIEITAVRYSMVPASGLSKALLLQRHWESDFKLNMKVSFE